MYFYLFFDLWRYFMPQYFPWQRYIYLKYSNSSSFILVFFLYEIQVSLKETILVKIVIWSHFDKNHFIFLLIYSYSCEERHLKCLYFFTFFSSMVYPRRWDIVPLYGLYSKTLLFIYSTCNSLHLLLLSHLSRVQLCATP